MFVEVTFSAGTVIDGTKKNNSLISFSCTSPFCSSPFVFILDFDHVLVPNSCFYGGFGCVCQSRNKS